jgi:hypothetical protein
LAQSKLEEVGQEAISYRSCGTCTLCCKLPAIRDEKLNKPANQWCGHCKPGKGCGVYQDRPTSCIDFQCLWTHEYAHGFPLPLEFRPDRVRAYIIPTVDGRDLHVVVDPGMPDAWRNGEFGRALRAMARAGDMRILIQIGTKYIRLYPYKGDLKEVYGEAIVQPDGKTTDVHFKEAFD